MAIVDHASAATASAIPLGLPRLSLVLGGARSGKSAHAEALIERAIDRGAAGAVYLAIARAGDAEMAARIARHRARRGPYWQTVEEPLELARTLAAQARPDQPILVECLTLWVSNLMAAGRDLAAEREALLRTLPSLSGPVVLVSNEVGLGIVPDNALARAFRDEIGILHQAIARLADHVVFVAAGLPLVLKGHGTAP